VLLDAPPQARTVRLSTDIEYRVIDVGVGTPVALLHGFPDTSDLWRHQIPALVAAGYRVIAPDLRGFGGSSKPSGVDHYRMLRVVGDISALFRQLDVERAHVVGHDWGAAIAWTFAALMSAKVDHLVAVSVGHPQVFTAPTIEQRRLSWYMLLYQFEGTAEELLTRHNWRLFREGHADSPDLDRYVANLSQPGALSSALNWYRANRSPAVELETPPRLPLITAPTMGVWGAGDQALLERGMLESRAFVRGPWRYERVDDAAHWVPLTRADAFTRLLLEFLDSHPVAEATARRRRRY